RRRPARRRRRAGRRRAARPRHHRYLEVRPMTMSSERFLVTGAAGCIGAWVVRLLLDEGVPVVATDLSADLHRFQLISQGRPADQPEADKLEFDQLDVTSGADVAAMVAGRGITHIVHLAGLQLPFCAADPPLGAMVNVVGTVNVFEAIRAAGRGIGLAFAPDCARAFIASARAAAGSGDAVSLNVPGRRTGIPALVELIEHILPGSGRFITWDDKPLRVPSLLSGSALRDAVGDLPNAWLADGVRETIAGFQAALAAGLVTPALS